ncbi:MAG: site-2 protease family protein [Holdemania massiliensis]
MFTAEFSIGMGPKLWSYKGKETTFTLRALPIGGYVAMAGEEGSEFEGVPRERTIKGVSHWKQIIIMLAGVIMNFVLAWLIFASIILINGSYNIAPKAVVGGVVEVHRRRPSFAERCNYGWSSLTVRSSSRQLFMRF